MVLEHKVKDGSDNDLLLMAPSHHLNQCLFMINEVPFIRDILYDTS